MHIHLYIYYTIHKKICIIDDNNNVFSIKYNILNCGGFNFHIYNHYNNNN